MLLDAFPNYLEDDVAAVIKSISLVTNTNVTLGSSSDFLHYHLDKRVIKFPYRIYYNDNSDEYYNTLTRQQKMILHFIYSRNFDGFVRQKHISSLLKMDYEDWAIPYIVKVCDEYIVEILELVYDFLGERNTEKIKIFCFENAEQFCNSYNRMISYCDVFYKYKYNDFQTYIGRKLFNHSRTRYRRMRADESPRIIYTFSNPSAYSLLLRRIITKINDHFHFSQIYIL